METAHPLVYIGLLLILSYAGGKIANYLKAPRVSGYLVLGMLLSPSVLGIYHERLVQEELALVTDMTLAIIAFSIGGSLALAKLKRLGNHIVWITLCQALGAFVLAVAILALFFALTIGSQDNSSSYWSSYFPMALVIGAICAATAPAAILAIVQEYRSQGPFTTILLGVVALDDALTILFYACASAVAFGLVTQQGVTWQNFLLFPGLSILSSLCIGGTVGVGIRRLIRFVSRREAMLGVMVGSIFLTSGLAISLKGSPLLANMMLGFVVINLVGHHEDLFAVVESIEEPLFGMFFTLAGAHLDFRVMKTAGWLALLITLGRFAGKLLGSRLGARISRAPKVVKQYFGLALLPTAGVTVGLALEAKAIFEPHRLSDVMVNAVLGSVVINELLTPFLVRFSLMKAGEVRRADRHDQDSS